MKRNKYNARKVKYKGIEFDSKLELDIYIMLENAEETEKILNLYKNNKSVILAKMGYFLKNGKKSKVTDIKYKYDFSFYARNLTLFGHDLKNINVNVEIKSTQTAKARDYSLRRRLYLNTLEKDEVFLEIVYDKKKGYKTTLWSLI